MNLEQNNDESPESKDEIILSTPETTHEVNNKLDNFLSEKLFNSKSDDLSTTTIPKDWIINTRDTTEVFISTLDDYELEEYLEDIEYDRTLIENDSLKVQREISFRKSKRIKEKEQQKNEIKDGFSTPVILVLSGTDRYYGLFTNGAEAIEWIDKQPLNLRLRFSFLRLRSKEISRPDVMDWYFSDTNSEFTGIGELDA